MPATSIVLRLRERSPSARGTQIYRERTRGHLRQHGRVCLSYTFECCYNQKRETFFYSKPTEYKTNRLSSVEHQ
jgi:hypothetical protein